MKQREKLSSRLGFILLSAGCAIGIGNVYRFPIITGSYGGAIFVLIYIGFLILLGLPAMTAEFSVGRASQRSIATSFEALEKPGQKWHLMKYFGIAGNYLLMMCYTTISGWMLIYFFQYLSWNGFNPAVIATASTNGSVELFSVDEACMDSTVGVTTYSAVNGIENHFHGRVLTVTDLIRGDDIKSEIEEFETSMRSNNMKEYCEKMVSITNDKEENEIWSFMKVIE